jgi:hypothetical protein
MIQVPYLSPEKLDELEREGVSGVDLCGNGIVIVPGKLLVRRSGEANQYRDSRPLNNPYRGRSAMVARMFLRRRRWKSLTDLAASVRAQGCDLSLPQASKAVRALEEELIVSKSKGEIALREPLRLLDALGREWRSGWARESRSLRLPEGTPWAQRLSSIPRLQWAVAGESSVSRYATFSQGGPRRIAVSNLAAAAAALGGAVERVPSFSDVELIETEEPGLFFGNEVDERGIRWASAIQTWLELQAGDARQRDAANDVRERILKEVGE